MRTISIRDDIQQIVLQYVRALPDIYLSCDPARVELVEYHEDGMVFSADIVLVESDDTELVLGDLSLGTGLILEIDLYPDENELELTSEQII